MTLRPIAAALLILAVPAAAQQQSQSYKFLQAVRDGKGNDVIAILDQPGQTIINTRDVGSGEGALHIVVRRGDMPYLVYLLQKGADANLRDREGNTPMLLGVENGRTDLVEVLTRVKANANLGNRSGVTPLIRAVQKGDLQLTRLLLANGANPDQADILAGMSARDYAKQDARLAAIAKLIDETPKKAARAVAGPTLR